jgi:cation diffusion facilitator family transporter
MPDAPKARLNRGLRATFVGMGVNALLTGAKFTAGVLGHSNALIADAVESLADMISSIIVWRGLVVAAAPADKDHPYGHGKAEPLAAAFVATMLLIAAGLIGARSANQLTLESRQMPHAFTLYVLLGVVLVKELMYRFVSREAGSMESITLYSDAAHHRSDAITSLAAAVGITVALIGGPKWAKADDAAAIIAACIIAYNGFRLLRPAVNELMDTSASRAFVHNVEVAAAEVEGVEKIEKCLARKSGYQYLVDMHVEVDPQMTVADAHEISHKVKDHVRAKVPEVSDVLVHIEPSQNQSKK